MPDRTGFCPDFLKDGGKPLLLPPASLPGISLLTSRPPGEPVFLLNRLFFKIARRLSLIIPDFMFASICVCVCACAPAGIDDTLAMSDITDRFGIQGEPPRILGEASIGLPDAADSCFAKKNCSFIRKTSILSFSWPNFRTGDYL